MKISDAATRITNQFSLERIERELDRCSQEATSGTFADIGRELGFRSSAIAKMNAEIRSLTSIVDTNGQASEKLSTMQSALAATQETVQRMFSALQVLPCSSTPWHKRGGGGHRPQNLGLHLSHASQPVSYMTQETFPWTSSTAATSRATWLFIDWNVYVAVIAIGVPTDVRINKQIARWSIENPPSDWAAVRARVIRTLFSVPAFVLYAAAMILGTT